MNTPDIIQQLSRVFDPHSGINLVERSMIRDLKVEPPLVSFTLEVQQLSPEQKSQLNFACQEAIQSAYPEAQVHIHMISLMPDGGEAAPNAVPQVRNIIAVASGKGGVGKSTVSVNLALGLKMLGARVGILDADLYGPSIPTMLGLKGQRPQIKEVYGKPRIVPLEAHGLYAISIGNIVEPEQAIVLRGPRLSGVIKQFFNECLWPELDYLVVDLPPGTGDIQLTLVQTVPVTGAVLVTTPQEVAVADAIKAMNMFLLPQVNVPILGVVENMSWFTPAEMPDHKYFLFGQGGGKQLAREGNTVLLGQIPLVQSIREGGDAGTPVILREEAITREAFVHLAQQTARQVAYRHDALAPTQAVKMQE